MSSDENARVEVQKLTLIETERLPDSDRARIAQPFERHTYPVAEIQDRVRIAFQNLGYFNARVDHPKISPVGQNQGVKDVDVLIRVDQGIQYRLGEIRFEKESLFPPDRMRKLFRIQNGDLFNYSTIANGLEQLRELYATAGHVDFVANPETRIDDVHRMIGLTIEVDEGKPYNFGRLVLNGTEPRAGAGRMLLASWKALEGKRYSPFLLEHWVRANTSDWPIAPAADSIVATEDPKLRVVNVQVGLP